MNFLSSNYLSFSFRYLSRIIRARGLQFVLKLSLAIFYLEKLVNPVDVNRGKRLLIIVIGGLGDCLLFDPLFRRLKEKWKNSEVDVLTGSFEDMWQQLESVDNLIFFSPFKFKSILKYICLFRIIYRRNYDIVAEGIAMIPPRGIYPFLTAFVFEASQAPIRLGRENIGRLSLLQPRKFTFLHSADIARMKPGKVKLKKNRYITHRINLPPPDKRDYHESTKIFEPLGVQILRKKNEPKLQCSIRHDNWAKNLINHWASNSHPVVGLTIETTRVIKAWPVEKFISVIEKGIDANMRFIVLGLDRKVDKKFPGTKFPKSKLLNLSGQTSLSEMIAIINQCDIFLSSDTGPSHIAQACGVPSIVLFGPSNEKEFGPVDMERHTLILPEKEFQCRPCVLGPCINGTSCMPYITVETVFKELQIKSNKIRLQRSGTIESFAKHTNILFSM